MARSSTQRPSRVGPATAPGRRAGALDVDALLDDPTTGIIVCCGSGGVGKTTTSAALALRAAERGRKVVVLTIDPARRLAQSMGIEELDNTPRPVTGVEGTGSLDAMMLDMKRTFDEVVLSQASPRRRSRSWPTRSTSRCRARSRARRSTWRWRSSARFTGMHRHPARTT